MKGKINTLKKFNLKIISTSPFPFLATARTSAVAKDSFGSVFTLHVLRQTSELYTSVRGQAERDTASLDVSPTATLLSWCSYLADNYQKNNHSELN